MSFRGRLRLFFALIVIVPMIALGIVLFALTARTETGKADAGIGTAARTALAVHRDGVAAAAPGPEESGCGCAPAAGDRARPHWRG